MSNKKDPDSWKARSIERRDFRHEHGEPEVPRHVGKKKKNTKKWCKGKLGVEHTFNTEPWRGAPTIATVQVCSKCGKHGKLTLNRSITERYFK